MLLSLKKTGRHDCSEGMLKANVNFGASGSLG